MQGKVYEKHHFWVVDHQFYQMQVAAKVILVSMKLHMANVELLGRS